MAFHKFLLKPACPRIAGRTQPKSAQDGQPPNLSQIKVGLTFVLRSNLLIRPTLFGIASGIRSDSDLCMLSPK